jgi:hypothetical protein
MKEPQDIIGRTEEGIDGRLSHAGELNPVTTEMRAKHEALGLYLRYYNFYQVGCNDPTLKVMALCIERRI